MILLLFVHITISLENCDNNQSGYLKFLSKKQTTFLNKEKI